MLGSARTTVSVAVGVLVAGATALAGVPAQAAPASATAPGGSVAAGARAPQTVGSDTSRGPRVVTTRPGEPLARPSGVPQGASPQAVATAFAQSRATELGIRGTLRGLSTRRTLAGGRVVRLQQEVGGVPVLGGEVVVDLDADGRTRSAVSQTLVGATPGTGPRIRLSEAIAAITEVAGVQATSPGAALRVSTPTLAVYDPVLLGAPSTPGAQAPRLVWRAEVTSPGDLSFRRLVILDAVSGKPILNLDLVARALNRAVCDSNNVPSTGADVDCTSGAAVRIEGQAPVLAPDDVDQAYDFAGRTWLFYQSVLGRDSVDGLGLTLKSTVRWCPPTASGEDCPYTNAFWNGSQMVYGDGYAAADDVVAHELTHGVTQFSSDLFYYFQSGAINESISDIFGEFVDLTDASDGSQDSDPATRWLMGEDLPGGAVRNMANPAAFGQPDTTQSTRYEANMISGPAFDAGAVHTNSGVGNRFASLLVDGGTLSGVTVPPLSGSSDEAVTRAAKIIYEATQRMTSATDYRGLAAGLRTACAALVGTASITSDDCTGVDLAIRAVTMDRQPAVATTPHAPVCPTGQVTATRFSDTMDNPAKVNWQAGGTRVPASLASGNWPLWYYASQPNVYGEPQRYATSGTNNLWGDDPGLGFVSNHTMTMKTAIKVAGTTYFRFDHAFGFQSDNTANYDGGVVEYSVDNGATWIDAGPLMRGSADNGYGYNLGGERFSVLKKVRGGNPLGGKPAFTWQSQGYITSRANLSSLTGKYVKLRFRIGTDKAVGDYGWFIDNVSVYSCMPLLSLSTPGPVVGGPTYLSWGANDRTSRTVTTYRSATAGFGRPLSAYGPAILAPATRALRVSPPSAGTACTWMTSRDLDTGRVSQATRCLTLPVDDRRLTASTGWKKASRPGAFGATLRVATAKGRTLTLSGARGGHVTVLARAVRNGGKLGVYVNGRKIATITLSAKRSAAKRYNYAVSGLVGGRVKLKVLTSGRPVTIDGIAVRP